MCVVIMGMVDRKIVPAGAGTIVGFQAHMRAQRNRTLP
jgi:hypothetical protein